MLANRIRLLCGDRVIQWKAFRSVLLGVLRSIPNARVEDRFEYKSVQASPAMSIIKQTAQPHAIDDTTLLDLLTATNHLRCTEIRDKVYALLDVAKAGHIGITPDYNMPITTLLNTILRTYHEFKRPNSLQEVADQCRQLETLFMEDSDSMFSFKGQKGLSQAPQDAAIAASGFGLHGTPITLWWTSYYGHKNVENLLLKHDDVDGSVSLYSAAEQGLEMTAKLLLDTGKIDINLKHKKGSTTLLRAVQNGHLAIVGLLLDTGKVKINLQDAKDATALYVAASSGNLAAVKLLFDAGKIDIDPKLHGWRFLPPLGIAALEGHLAIVKVLLDSINVDINPEDCTWGWSELELAMDGEHPEIVKVLLDWGKIDINQRHPRTGPVWRNFDINQKYPLMGRLLGKIEMSGSFSMRDTALCRAARRGNESVVKLLLDTGKAEFNSKDILSGRTALSWAASEGHERVVKMLLGTGKVEVNSKDQDGRTALWLAVESGNEGIVKLLLLSPGTVNKNSWEWLGVYARLLSRRI